jgi:hypothetical protein
MSDMILGFSAILAVLTVLGIYLFLQRNNSHRQINPENLSQGKPQLVNIGYPYQSDGSCTVCGLNRVFILNVPPTDFVASYYQLDHENNWICTQCWVTAQDQNPDKTEKQLALGQNDGYGIISRLAEGTRQHLALKDRLMKLSQTNLHVQTFLNQYPDAFVVDLYAQEGQWHLLWDAGLVGTIKGITVAIDQETSTIASIEEWTDEGNNCKGDL